MSSATKSWISDFSNKKWVSFESDKNFCWQSPKSVDGKKSYSGLSQDWQMISFMTCVCKANPIMQALKNHQRPRVDRLTYPKNYNILDLGSVIGSMPCTLDVRCEISMFKMSASKNLRGNPGGAG